MRLTVLPHLFFFSISAYARASFEIPEALQNGIKGNPGMQTCLRQRSLPILAKLLGNIMDNEITKINPPDTTVKLASSNRGSLTVRNTKIVSYSKNGTDSMTMHSPDQVEWISSGLEVNMTGQFHSSIQQIISNSQTTGAISISAKNTTLVIRTRIHARNGTQQFDVISCKANIGDSSISTQASGFFGALSSFFRKLLSSSAPTLIERILCNTVRYYIESILNEMYSPQMIPTNTPNSTDQNQGQSQIDFLSPRLIFNYAFLKDPRVYPNCIGMQEIGEVSWQNKRETPFYPQRLNYSTKSSNDHMIDIWLSDYTLNSLLYHANDHRLLNLILTEERTPQWTAHLQSQCSDPKAVDCIGNILSELSNAEDFPDQIIEIRLKPSSATVAPYLQFHQDPGTILVADVIMEMYAKDTEEKRKNILNVNAHFECNLISIKLNVSNSVLLTAEAANSNATLKIAEGQSLLKEFVSKKRLSNLANFTANLVENILNSKLNSGFPLPRISGLTIISAEAAVFNHTVNIAADIDFNTTYWTNEAEQARIRLQKETE